MRHYQKNIQKTTSCRHPNEILVINHFNAQILFYNKFIIYLYMFRALCAHHQEVKTYCTASGIITPVGGRPVHRLSGGGGGEEEEQVFSQPVHRTATYRV